MSLKNPRACRFYIVRHGQTEWNKRGILQGQMDSPLTEKGLLQAAERSKTFKNIKFASAFSSDLFRCQKTAEIIATEHDLAITTSKLLRERTFGSYEGRKASEWKLELKRLLETYEDLSEEERFVYKAKPDVESDEEIVGRMLTFIRETAVGYPGKNVLVVSHGGILRATLVKLGFGTYQELSHGAIENLGYVVIESDGTDFFIKETQGINKLG